MNTKTTLPISEARKKIFKITEEVRKPGVFYTLTDRGRPKAVIMSAEEFESWAETLEVMQEMPNLKKDIEQTKKDIQSGRYKKYKTLDQIVAEYDLSDNSKTKSRKRAKKTSR